MLPPTSNSTPHEPMLPFYSWRVAIRSALTLMLLCGGLYPLLTVGIAHTAFPRASTGSLIVWEDAVVGSSLVGQSFQAPGYFHGRPSAAGYDPFSVSGSNLAPSNPALRARAEAHSLAMTREEQVDAATIPADLIAASGSGIDPHITPEAATIQIERVARNRGLTRDTVASLVAMHIEAPTAGVLGRPRVNVLALNLALDRMSARSQAGPAASNPPVSPVP